MENEGNWAWALGKKNDDTRVIAKRWKSLGKTAFQHPCTAGDWLGKKNDALAWPGTRAKTLGNQWFLQGPRHVHVGVSGSPSARLWGHMGYGKNLGILENHWKSTIPAWQLAVHKVLEPFQEGEPRWTDARL